MRNAALCIALFVAFSTAFSARSASAVEVSFEKDSSLPIVFLNVAVAAGSASDPVERLGLTHFMGEMMLRGTTSKDKEEIDLALDQMGAALEVETRSEATIFRGAVLSSQLDPFLALLTEIITRPSFPDDEIDNLKSEVKSQILDELGSDERLAGLAFDGFLFGDHPYGKPVLGKLKTVNGLTRQEILDHYREIVADDMIFVVGSGDAKSSKISDWAKSLGKTLPERGAQELARIPAPTHPPTERLLIVDKPDRTQTQITGGQIGIKMTDPDFFPIFLGNEAFGGESFSSRLMNEIRVKRGWSYGAYSYFKYSREPRSWQFYLFPAEKDTPSALAYTLKLIRELQQHGITNEEFSFSKQRLVNNSGFMYNTPSKRVENALTEKILDLPEGFMKSYGPNLEKVTLEQVNAAIEKFLRPDQLSIVVVGTASHLKRALAKAAGLPVSKVQVVPYKEE